MRPPRTSAARKIPHFTESHFNNTRDRRLFELTTAQPKETESRPSAPTPPILRRRTRFPSGACFGRALFGGRPSGASSQYFGASDGPRHLSPGAGCGNRGGAGLTRHFEGGNEEQLLRACTWHGRVRKVPSSAKHRGVIASPPPPPESALHLPRCDHFSDSQYHSPLRNHLAKHFWRTQRAIARGAFLFFPFISFKKPLSLPVRGSAQRSVHAQRGRTRSSRRRCGRARRCCRGRARTRLRIHSAGMSCRSLP